MLVFLCIRTLQKRIYWRNTLISLETPLSHLALCQGNLTLVNNHLEKSLTHSIFGLLFFFNLTQEFERKVFWFFFLFCFVFASVIISHQENPSPSSKLSWWPMRLYCSWTRSWWPLNSPSFTKRASRALRTC